MLTTEKGVPSGLQQRWIGNKHSFWETAFSRDRVSQCSPGCPGTHYVYSASLQFRDPLAPASQMGGLKVWCPMPSYGETTFSKADPMLMSKFYYACLKSSFMASII